MEVKYSNVGFFVWVGFILGVVVAAVLCTYMWLEPAMECEKYKQVVAEQSEVIERYKIQNETMKQIIDGTLKEEKK